MMNKMKSTFGGKKKVWAAIGTAALLASAAIPALAATSDSVTATVTVQSISITVSDGSVAYGILGVNTSKDTTLGQLNDTQTVTNNGNVNETLLIRGQNSDNWTLEGAAGVDQYVHQVCTAGTGVTDPCDTNPVYTALSIVNQALPPFSVYTPTAIQKFDLKITTPTSSSVSAQQNVSVTVVATIAP